MIHKKQKIKISFLPKKHILLSVTCSVLEKCDHEILLDFQNVTSHVTCVLGGSQCAEYHMEIGGSPPNKCFSVMLKSYK